MKKPFLLIFLIIGAGILAWLVWPRPSGQTPANVAGYQVTPVAGFSRALGPVPFSFPLDYGPHLGFQTEWWYYTGNLQTASGRRFGFELTFFRRALQPPDERQTRASDMAADQVYMAHFALTDVSGNQFYYKEHFSRGAAGLAEAVGLPAYQVWLGDWLVQQTGPDTYHLTAIETGFAVDLDLKDLKGPVLQGDRGFSQKGPGIGNASYYISQTRLHTSGNIRVGDADLAVNGLSWMDHEYSTSALSGGQVGWDWFALQLDDGSEVTAYNLRMSNGSIDPYSRGMLVRPDGTTVSLAVKEYTIGSGATWKSPHSQATYPEKWTLDIPSEHLKLTITPYIPDQELNVSFVYWEGAVKVEGEINGRPVSGSGYVELTGYAQSLAGQF